jgi:hypothetical protein
MKKHLNTLLVTLERRLALQGDFRRQPQHRQFREVTIASGQFAAGLPRLRGDPDVIGGNRFALAPQE